MKIEIRDTRDLFKTTFAVTIISIIFANAMAYLFETTISPPFKTSDIWGTTLISGTASFIAAWLIFKQNYALHQKSNKLEKLNEELLSVQQELRRQANTDGLTGLINQRSFLSNLQQEIARYERHGSPFSLILIDIDHFKKVNDLFGHSVGDSVLCSFARQLQTMAREIDIVARTGGEEFCILLPETKKDEAYTMAERIRQEIEKTPMSIGDIGVPITISIGLTEIQDHETHDSIYRRADTALYRAKFTGRNCVEIE